METESKNRCHCYFDDPALAAGFHKAFLRLIAEVHKDVTTQYMPPENTLRMKHGGRLSHPGLPNVTGGSTHEQSSNITIAFKDLIAHDLSAINRCIHKLTSDMAQQFGQIFYSTISTTCGKTGNVVDAKASGSIEEALVEMLEKVEFSVAIDGTVQLPQVHMGSSAYAAFKKAIESATPDFHQRVDAIKKRKSLEALAQEADRKAKFVRYGDDS